MSLLFMFITGGSAAPVTEPEEPPPGETEYVALVVNGVPLVHQGKQIVVKKPI